MPNMSYCRFHNTNLDVRDCLDAIRDGEALSDSEMDCCKELFRQFMDFCYEARIIDSDEIDNMDERLEEFFGTIGDEAYWN